MPPSLPVHADHHHTVGGVAGQGGDCDGSVQGENVLNSCFIFLLCILSSSMGDVTAGKSIFLCQCDEPVQHSMGGVSLPDRYGQFLASHHLGGVGRDPGRGWNIEDYLN